MKYNFDEIIDRKNTGSIKFDRAQGGRLPLWVADMDFKSPPCVIESLFGRAAHGIFGYTDLTAASGESIKNWLKTRHNINIDTDYIVGSPSVMTSIGAAIKALSKAGESVLIQEPVYHPFSRIIKSNGRNLVVNKLVYGENGYTIDLNDFESKIKSKRVKLFILCNPHNPVGRVWTREELTAMADICFKYGVVILSDEIHLDFTYGKNKHLSVGFLNENYKNITITLISPTKTFNIAALNVSYAVIADKTLRNKFVAELDSFGIHGQNLMGTAASIAAYTGGGEWLDSLILYLQANIDFAADFLKSQMPKIKFFCPQGTYLLWLDFNKYGLTTEKLDDIIENEAKLILNAGHIFGSGGEGFQRVNIACPKSVLQTALSRLNRAFKNL